MNNKSKKFIFWLDIVIVIVIAIIILWISGVIPKQIAKISATNYLEKNFPKAKLQYLDIEWSPSHGDYLIQFRDKNNNLYGFCVGPKYFPIQLGQGMNEFMEEYREKYDEKELNGKKYVELEKLSFDYDFAKMVEDKCYIVSRDNIVYHIDELNNFMKNVGDNIPDEIRVIDYTIEGQPILKNLEYKDNKFILKIDNTRDGYALQEDKKIITKKYDAKNYELVKAQTPNPITNLKTYYSLDLKSSKKDETIPICNYAEIKQTQNYNFEIEFNKDTKTEEITKILDKEEQNKYDYNIYSYKGNVDVIINGEKMSLRDALLNNKITVEEILQKAIKDAKEDKIIFGDAYLDGGSTFYIYDDYQILKCNTLTVVQGKISYIKDLYIGVPSMNINDLRE